jgi:ankyrin repeat protein
MTGLIIVLLVSPLVLANDQESARQVLEKSGIPFTEDEFVERARQGDLTAVELMLDAGMSPDAQDENGTPALIAALFESESEIEVSFVMPGGGHASFWGSPEHLELLKKNAGMANFDEIMKGTQFHATIITLLDKGADPNASDKQGTPAIIYAAREGIGAITRALLDKGADVNAKNADGESALLLAAENGHDDIVAMLIESGADVNAKNRDGQSVLKTAVDSGGTEVVRMLLAGGAELPAGLLMKSIKEKDGSNSKPPSVEDRIKALEAAVIILQMENASKQSKIAELEADVTKLKEKVRPHLELLSRN